MAVKVRRFVPGLAALFCLIGSLAAHADFATQSWARRFSSISDSTDQAKKVLADTNGNVFVVGNTDDHLVAQDWLIIKYSNAGAPLWTNRYNSPDNSVDTAKIAALDPRGNVIVAGISSTNYLVIKYSTTNGAPLWTNVTQVALSAIATDPSGNVIVTGNNGSPSDYGTIKYSSNGVPVWTNIFAGAAGGNDFPAALAVDSSGNVIVTGNSDTGGGTNDIVTIKYSSAGATVWTKSFNGPGNSYDVPTDVAVDSSGNVFVTGYTFNGTTYDWVTIRYNSAGGAVSWTKFYSSATNSSDFTKAIAVDGSGNVFVTGSSQTGTNFITIKYSNTGTALWTNRYGTAGSINDSPNAIGLDTNGNIFVTGSSQLSIYDAEFLTLKYSTAGVVLWTNRFHGPSSAWPEQAFSVAVDIAGDVFVTGTSGASGVLGNTDIATIKYSNAGVSTWTNRYTGPAHGGGQVNAIALDSSGNSFVTGNAPNTNTWQMTTIKYAPDGSALWTNFFNGSSNSSDSAAAIALDAAGDVFVAGNSGIGNSSDFAALKYSSAGVLLWSNFYNGPANSNDLVIAAATDGTNLFVTGYSYTTASNQDYATIKYSGSGVPLWTNRFGTTNSDQPRAIAVDSAGNVFVTGVPATIKYSNSGVPLWTNISLSFPVALALDYSNNVILVGNTNTFQQLITIKLSNAGLPLWTNSYDGPSNIFGFPYDFAQAVATDRKGNIFIAGYDDPFGAGVNRTFLTLAYSSSGVPLWTNSLAVSGTPSGIAVDLVGNVFVSGNGKGPSGNVDYTTLAFSNSGVPLSTNQYNGPANGAETVAITCPVTGTDGSVFVTGGSDGNFSSDFNYGTTYDFATVKYVYGMASAIAAQPLSRTNFVGTTANFTVTAAGTPPLYYQWLRNGTNLLNGGNISGATTNSLSISNVALADGANYSVIVTNAYGSTTGSVAALSVPPVSSVLPLPAFAGPWFLVQWSGQAAANATLRFDIYLSTNGSTFALWQSNTAATNAPYRGSPGQTYYFYSVARDSAGLQEMPPGSADAQTTVPSTAPVLAPIANATNNPGQPLTFTNSLLSGTPVGSYLFSLDVGAPPGSTITSSNGIFIWTPNCSQASTMNLITVRVTDSGQTNLTDALAFIVAVNECVSPQLGRVVMAVGDTNRVPINLISSVPLTNLTMRLLLAEGHLVNPTLQPIVPQICSSGVQPITNGQFLLSFGTCSNQFLIGTQQVAWLNFTAISNQSSAFVPLNLDQITGHEPNGSSVANFAPQNGRVVIVGLEPLLEALLATNQDVTVTLYAAVSSTNELSVASALNPPVTWLPRQEVVMTNLFRDFPSTTTTNQMQLFRAVRQMQ